MKNRSIGRRPAPTAAIGAPRPSTSAGQTASTSSSTLRRPRPCAAMPKRSRRAPKPVSRPGRRRPKYAGSRSFTTALQVGAASNASLHASKRAKRSRRQVHRHQSRRRQAKGALRGHLLPVRLRQILEEPISPPTVHPAVKPEVVPVVWTVFPLR